MPENTVYLAAAFIIVWLLFLGYALYLNGRVNSLHQEVHALHDDLNTHPAGGSNGQTGI